jgi:hypothetical protein
MKFKFNLDFPQLEIKNILHLLRFENFNKQYIHIYQRTKKLRGIC